MIFIRRDTEDKKKISKRQKDEHQHEQAGVGLSLGSVGGRKIGNLVKEFLNFKAKTEANWEMIMELLKANFRTLESIRTRKAIEEIVIPKFARKVTPSSSKIPQEVERENPQLEKKMKS